MKLRFAWAFRALLAVSFAAPPVGASAAVVERVVVRGAVRTRETTLLELLPRRPPSTYSAAELGEFERRVNNLAIFDRVEVTHEGSDLVVAVREKWTLIPSVEFASGSSFEDHRALLGVTEFNFLGTGDQVGLAFSREQRGWGITAGFGQHPYRRGRWTVGGEASYSTAGLRFEDGSSWRVRYVGGTLWFNSPPWLHEHLSYKVGVWGSSETVSDVVGEGSPSGIGFGTLMTFTWDAYQWHDLVPRGFVASTSLGSGFMADPTPSPRDNAELSLVGAVPLWPFALFTFRDVSSVVTRGNANGADLLGSVDGVRGLEDAYYRTWLSSYANLELRQALPFGSRWAIQGVVFADGALFEQLTSDGGRGARGRAFSLGAGARLIPTWLAGILLRVDAARLLLPERRWFVQVGLGQYF